MVVLETALSQTVSTEVGLHSGGQKKNTTKPATTTQSLVNICLADMDHLQSLNHCHVKENATKECSTTAQDRETAASSPGALERTAQDRADPEAFALGHKSHSVVGFSPARSGTTK